MSWYLKKIGSPYAIKAAVAKEQYMPEGIKAGIVAVCDMAQPNEMVFVDSTGSLGHPFGTAKTLCECIAFEPDPVPPVSNDNVAPGAEQFSTQPPAAPKEGAV